MTDRDRQRAHDAVGFGVLDRALSYYDEPGSGVYRMNLESAASHAKPRYAASGKAG